MRRNSPSHADSLYVLDHDAKDVLADQLFSRSRQEEGSFVMSSSQQRTEMLKISFDHANRLFGDWNNTFLGALSQYSHHTDAIVQVGNFQSDQFARSHPGSIQECHDSPVARGVDISVAVGRLQKLSNGLVVEYDRKAVPFFGAVDAGRRILPQDIVQDEISAKHSHRS